MRLDPSRVLVSLKRTLKPDASAKLFASLGFATDDGKAEKKERGHRCDQIINHTDRRLWLRTQDGEPASEDQLERLEEALGEELEWVGPVYRLGDVQGPGGLLCPLPNVLLVKTGKSADKDKTAMARAQLGKVNMHIDEERSKYLGDYRYLVLDDPRAQTAYEVRAELLALGREMIADVSFESMPMVRPLTLVPIDPLFAQQWNMRQVQAGGPGVTGWDLTAGVPGVVIAVLDEGCDLTHPDLAFAGPGINLGTMMPSGSPTTGAHGTACAGIAAGRFNNPQGISGVAGNCTILPIAFASWSDAECAAGINFAAANGASVLSMSFGMYAPGEGFGPTGWNFALIDPAITNAVNVRGCVLVSTTGNENTGAINRYPARHPLVIAVGGSDRADNRKSPASPDGECWGANFGPGTSVVAPAVQTPTTDIRGTAGYNFNNGGARRSVCVDYPTCGDAAGDYYFIFNGTSTAAPHVAGLAALLRSLYPGLTVPQVRNIIEQTADKVGGTYAEVPGFANGTRNVNMGYGRINVLRALDSANLMIRDWPGDDGAEPSTAADFWDFSDIAVRPNDDDIFRPDDFAQSSRVERGQTNYVYVRVTNNGPRAARNVVADVRITPFAGSQFSYPIDWTAIDGTHVRPTPITASFPSLAPGASAIAKFSLTAAQVEMLWGWENLNPWHPCMLASVTADNDYAFANAAFSGSPIVVHRNNLAQRNLTVVDMTPGTSLSTFAFVAGHALNQETSMELVIDRSRLPKEMSLLLALDEDGRAFPQVEFERETRDGEAMIFLERTKLKAAIGCRDCVLVLEKGSRLECSQETKKLGKVQVDGGEVVLRGEKRFVDVREEKAVVRVEKEAGALYPLALVVSAAKEEGRHLVRVAQRDMKGELVGGVSAIFVTR